MAEFVNLHMEHFLTELEEMERVKLFTPSEIKIIIKNRRKLEYTLRKMQKKKDYYLKYIKYEMDLLNLIGKRRERLLIDAKKPEIDSSIAHRIKRLFKGAISRYPEDEKLWLDQIEFCKEMKWFNTVSVLQKRMLRVHPKKPELWIMSAKWQLEYEQSPQNALELFEKGSLRNPKSEMLWREFFHMELVFSNFTQISTESHDAHSMKDLEKEKFDSVLSGQFAIDVFDRAVKNIEDPEFALSFLQICMKFDFCHRHIDHIFQYVKDRFPASEVVRDALAKRPLIFLDERIKKGKEIGIRKKTTLLEVKEEIQSSYETAVKYVPTEKMWDFYLDYSLDCIKSAKESKKIAVQRCALDVMERASAADCLNQEHVPTWVDLLFDVGDEERGLRESLNGARKWKSVSLWCKCLTSYMRCASEPQPIYDLLTEALDSHQNSDSIELWKLGIEWLSIANSERLVDLFEHGLKSRSEATAMIQQMYLQMRALKAGAESARELYRRFKKMGSIPYEVTQKIIQIEKGEKKVSIENIRKWFEDGIKEVGSSNVEIWLEYMKFETKQEGANPAANSSLYWRARKCLEPGAFSEFQNRACCAVTEL